MNQKFDIFLSHNSADKAIIRQIKQWLAERQLSVWLDEDELQPGLNWMPLLEKAICTCQSAGAFVGSNGIGPWEDEEIQALLSKAVRNKIPVIPVLLPGEYDAPEFPLLLGNRTFIDMRLGITSELLDKLEWGITGKKPQPKIKDVGLKPDLQVMPSIHSDRLPTVKGGFFGREAELQMLDAAWAGNGTHIIQFIAPGGTGKTKLLIHWLDHAANIGALLAWSFYAQGASEDKQVSTTLFFSHAFDKLGSIKTSFATDEDKGDHLADLLRAQRCVLVLDGLEPLQHAGRGMRGELKDRAIRQLLKSLAGQNNGLCIITTRIAVHELSDRAHVISHDLQNLAPADGVQLLQSLGVKGSAPELAKAVQEYGCHTLALSLLGNVLRLHHHGDVLKRGTLKALAKPTGDRTSRHAFKVMQAYADWFAGQPELALLHLLGLFDHPIGQEVLQVLWDAQIPHLTAGIDEDDWLEAIAGLREEHHLLSQHDGGGDLDCHPLIREYFGKQLQTQHPDAWQQAHARLYDYYKALPEKELPDTLEEMQPLFSAVAHGCAAGLHQQVLREVYWPRIHRSGDNYVCNRLGAISDDLATVAHFFTIPWHVPSADLTESEQTSMLNWVGSRLQTLGRLREALEPTQLAVLNFSKQEKWIGASANASNSSELELILGNIKTAVSIARSSVDYADRSKSMFWRMGTRTTYASTLHQTGKTAQALTLFQEAEQLQKKRQPKYPCLYALPGFFYCDLLMEQDRTSEVLERAEYALGISTEQLGLLITALDQLTLGRVYSQQKDFPQATHWLDQAVASSRAAEAQDIMPRSLLARAALFRHTHDFARARQDLQEVFGIAEPSGMRLHLTDYHLEAARLLLAEEENPPQSPFYKGGSQEGTASAVPPFEKGGLGGISLQAHIEATAKLITATGYHRRDQELLDLQQAIAKESRP